MKHRKTFKEYFSSSEDEAIFIVTMTGQIVDCNEKAVLLFGYKSMDQLINQNATELVPEDFSEYFPAQITPEHLTKGEYLPRVNKRKDGQLFPTDILTYYKTIDGINYVMVHVKEAVSCNDIQTLCLQQNIEVLHCELKKEKNARQTASFTSASHRLSCLFLHSPPRIWNFAN